MISGSVLEVTVRSGGNITLYCDCRVLTGVYIVWFRNCSHEDQPPLVVTFDRIYFSYSLENTKRFPRFQYVKNISSDSYDLVIVNVSDSDEGLYYCGTEEAKVDDKNLIAKKHFYKYSNTTTKMIVGEYFCSSHLCVIVVKT